MKIFQYQSYVTSISQSPEQPHVDAFQGQNISSNLPQSNWKQKSMQARFLATMPFFTIDTKQLTLPETPQIDKWLGNQPVKIYDLKRQQYTYPTFFVDTKQLTLSEDIRLDKWYKETEKPRWDIKHQQYLYPSSAFDTSQLNPASDLPVSAWSSLPQVIFKAKVSPAAYVPFLTIDTRVLTLPETVLPDKYMSATEKPRWDAKRQQYIYPFAAFFDPKPIAAAGTTIQPSFTLLGMGM